MGCVVSNSIDEIVIEDNKCLKTDISNHGNDVIVETCSDNDVCNQVETNTSMQNITSQNVTSDATVNNFMASIDKFIESHNDPNSVVNQIHNGFNVDKTEYNKQLKTFRDDIKLMCEGKMDYATMRSLYG